MVYLHYIFFFHTLISRTVLSLHSEHTHIRLKHYKFFTLFSANSISLFVLRMLLLHFKHRRQNAVGCLWVMWKRPDEEIGGLGERKGASSEIPDDCENYVCSERRAYTFFWPWVFFGGGGFIRLGLNSRSAGSCGVGERLPSSALGLTPGLIIIGHCY